MPVILFDVDGTLVRTHGTGRWAMARALQAVYGTAGPIDSYNMAGKTDRMIIHDLLAVEGIPLATVEARFPEYEAAYAAALEEALARRKPDVLPGVLPLLERLRAREDVVLGLLTGNLEPGARLKLQYAGIDPGWFQMAAFGSDALQRTDLAFVALRRAAQAMGRPVAGHEVVIVGDTPLDILCGRAIGAKSVAVATGPYSQEALRQQGADVVFPNLADTDQAERALLDGRVKSTV